MKQLVFSTGSALKFLTAKHACQPFGIELLQRDVDVPEIQSEDGEAIALDKAQKAYEIVGCPVVVTDDSWAFTGLGGFPGAYMKSMNAWLTAEDFLRLTLPLTDRQILLTQWLVFADGKRQKVFSQVTEGVLLKEICGTSRDPSLTVTSLDGDDGLSVAEAFEKSTDKSARRTARVWQDFAKWYTT